MYTYLYIYIYIYVFVCLFIICAIRAACLEYHGARRESTGPARRVCSEFPASRALTTSLDLCIFVYELHVFVRTVTLVLNKLRE